VSMNPRWWETFFEGVAVTMWLQAVGEDESRREADALERLMAAPPGGEILDVPCGGGRLSLALAARGYRPTAVDWSTEFLAHARRSDGANRVAWERRDMRDLPWPGRFDAAFCAGNSFGYLDDEGNDVFLRAVHAALKPGARFVLETPMVLENLLAHLQERPWWTVGSTYLLVENQYVASTARLEIDYTFIADGRVEVRHGSHRAYAYRELVRLLEAAGFSVTTERPWTRDAHTVTFIATRT
jgi:SAM-dependent methyltransferase